MSHVLCGKGWLSRLSKKTALPLRLASQNLEDRHQNKLMASDTNTQHQAELFSQYEWHKICCHVVVTDSTSHQPDSCLQSMTRTMIKFDGIIMVNFTD
jgi:hypothetical protein